MVREFSQLHHHTATAAAITTTATTAVTTTTTTVPVGAWHQLVRASGLVGMLITKTHQLPTPSNSTLDQAKLAHACYRQTDRQTDKADADEIVIRYAR
jgi:hypothetical protein